MSFWNWYPVFGLLLKDKRRTSIFFGGAGGPIPKRGHTHMALIFVCFLSPLLGTNSVGIPWLLFGNHFTFLLIVVFRG